MTDMHGLSLLGLTDIEKPLENKELWQSNWFLSVWPLMVFALVFAVASLRWWIFYRTDKKVTAVFGGDRFERVMVGRKPKKSRAKAKAKSAVKKEKVIAPVVEPEKTGDSDSVTPNQSDKPET